MVLSDFGLTIPPVQFPGSTSLQAGLLEKLSHIRSHWPKEVCLCERCDLPIFDREKPVQHHTYDANTTVRILSIEPDEGVVVTVGKSVGLVQLKQIDLVRRMGGAAAINAIPDDSPAVKTQSEVPVQ